MEVVGITHPRSHRWRVATTFCAAFALGFMWAVFEAAYPQPTEAERKFIASEVKLLYEDSGKHLAGRVISRQGKTVKEVEKAFGPVVGAPEVMSITLGGGGIYGTVRYKVPRKRATMTGGIMFYPYFGLQGWGEQ